MGLIWSSGSHRLPSLDDVVSDDVLFFPHLHVMCGFKPSHFAQSKATLLEKAEDWSPDSPDPRFLNCGYAIGLAHLPAGSIRQKVDSRSLYLETRPRV
jgi:hypothetical protein